MLSLYCARKSGLNLLNHISPDLLGYQAFKFKNMLDLLALRAEDCLSDKTGDDYNDAYEEVQAWMLGEAVRYGIATLPRFKKRRERTGFFFEEDELYSLIPQYTGRVVEVMHSVKLSLASSGRVTPTPKAPHSDNILNLAGKEIPCESKSGMYSLTGIRLQKRKILLGQVREYSLEGAIAEPVRILVTTTPHLKAMMRRNFLDTDREKVSIHHKKDAKGLSQDLEKSTFTPWDALSALKNLVENY